MTLFLPLCQRVEVPTYHASAGPLAHCSPSCFDDINREANVRAHENVTNGHANVHTISWASP